MRELLLAPITALAATGCWMDPHLDFFSGGGEPYCAEEGVQFQERAPVVLATGAVWRPMFIASGDVTLAAVPPGVLVAREEEGDLQAIAPGRATVTVEDRTCDRLARLEVEVRDAAAVAVEPISMAWLEPLPRALAPAGVGIPAGDGVTFGVIRRDAEGLVLQGAFPNRWTLESSEFEVRPYESPDSDHGDHAKVRSRGVTGGARLGADGAEGIELVALEAAPLVTRVAAHGLGGIEAGGTIELREGAYGILQILGYDAAGRLVSQLPDRAATVAVEPNVAQVVAWSGQGVYVDLRGLTPGEGTISVSAFGLPLEVPIRVVGGD